MDTNDCDRDSTEGAALLCFLRSLLTGHRAERKAWHRHDCPACGKRWQHRAADIEGSNDMHRYAHHCPRCGTPQFDKADIRGPHVTDGLHSAEPLQDVDMFPVVYEHSRVSL